MDEELLRIEDLGVWFFTEIGVIKAADNASLKVKRGRTLGLAGESGCGKTQLALSIMRLNPFPGRIVSGKIFFDGENLLTKTESEMRNIRGRRISIIFQDPTSSLNPVHTIGNQIAEAIKAHEKCSGSIVEKKIIELLMQVGVPSPEKRSHEYPHEFSGGMRQRAMIAMALACNPELLIADEPTTNLDVTVQAQVLDLMRGLQEKLGTSVLLISHDLGIIAEMCDDVAMMYAGKILEHCEVRTLFKEPKHPYTSMLLRSLLEFDKKVQSLNVIPGRVPSLIDPPSGCKFHPRCPHVMPICSKVEPKFINVGSSREEHYVACHLVSEKRE